MSAASNIENWFNRKIPEPLASMTGGRARLKTIVMMACVLGLSSADKATVGAIAGQLKHALHITNVEIGLLVTVTTGIGALATLPMGILTDRVNRVRLLWISVVFWGAAMVITGFSSSYVMLLVTRLFLGVVIATGYPVITSLTGDYFRPGARGRIWGYILSGELFGAGFGILVAGEVAAFLSWRYAFWVLAFVSFFVAAAIWRWLPEPPRGVYNRMPKDEEEIPPEEELQEQENVEDQPEDANKEEEEEDEVEKKIEEEHISPREEQVLESNPAEMPFWKAVRYILSIRTNVLLIIASACGYFFFTGLRTFAVVFMRGRFGLGPAMGKVTVVLLGLGAILGVLITGRAADRWIEQGHIRARITVGAAAFLITAVFFLAGFFMTSLAIAGSLFFLAAIGLGGVNAPLDAARLDIMHSRLWGRAESVRTTLRYTFEALAPIIFGWVTTLFGASGGLFSESSQSFGSSGIMPLTNTFRLMLIPVVIAAVVLYFAGKYYPRDVATVLASEEATSD